ncbi:hypothetical protein [Aneurinibacillus migulanus]|uniref:Membrane protein n=1 Tax=Aneurinibacillus migulanus TaxID=47500 RepID=A0A0D1Y433_ANEMI|nr:hypothetical protein [Aneurinibacillus migulanus]KIV54047.1 membrane protein [Aneurinibacillus migulanus]KON97710.1 membrane protein [Aneurinibacillus migulanus]MED0894480.1 hypothetical protein [Aneurinibacillus migulanus]MED1617090.1 hypothetical protein [Aneurinibacillus migulanus]SDJ34037.1 hypothetical protein SAMN04487909_1163 [Aneurinibacillus migulanus]
MSKGLSTVSGICLAVAAVLQGISILLPWWGMKFIAPQYPEGLDIVVYPYKLEGRIDIINGLNHYIGMKEFSAATFHELDYLPYVIGAMAILTLIAAIVRKKGILYVLIGLFVIGGTLGIYDMLHWLRSFGTELDPHAPIKISPFIPPIIGENRIANFITYSYFSYGSFLIGAAFLLVLLSLWKERKL